MTREALAKHFKDHHRRVAPGYASLADLKRFHAYLHEIYPCNHSAFDLKGAK